MRRGISFERYLSRLPVAELEGRRVVSGSMSLDLNLLAVFLRFFVVFLVAPPAVAILAVVAINCRLDLVGCCFNF